MQVFINIDANKYSSELTDEQKSFPDLSLLKKYDAVLDVLYSESGKAPTFDDIHAALIRDKKKLHWGEIMDILYTMMGDGYLYGHFVNQQQQQIFLISFNGKLLKETDGYEKKLEREKEKTGLTNRQLNASIASVNWSKGSIVTTLFLAVTTLGFVISNWNINNKAYHLQLDKYTRDSIDKLKTQQSDTIEKTQHLEISLSLKDSAPVRVKIEK